MYNRNKEKEKKKRKKKKNNTNKQGTERRKKGKQVRKENKKNEETKAKQACTQGEGRAPRTRLLFAGTISYPMICPADGPTQGPHRKTRRKTRRQEEGRDKQLTDNKQKTSRKRAIQCPVRGSRAIGWHNRHKEDRDRSTKRGAKKPAHQQNRETKRRIANCPTNRTIRGCSRHRMAGYGGRGYHRLGRE